MNLGINRSAWRNIPRSMEVHFVFRQAIQSSLIVHPFLVASMGVAVRIAVRKTVPLCSTALAQSQAGVGALPGSRPSDFSSDQRAGGIGTAKSRTLFSTSAAVRQPIRTTSTAG